MPTMFVPSITNFCVNDRSTSTRTTLKTNTIGYDCFCSEVRKRRGCPLIVHSYLKREREREIDMRSLHRLFSRSSEALLPSTNSTISSLASLSNQAFPRCYVTVAGAKGGAGAGRKQHKEDQEVGSGGEGWTFKHMAKTGEEPWSAVSEGGEPGKKKKLKDSPIGDTVVQPTARPSAAGTTTELQEEDFASEADWRRVGNETAGGPSLFDHERPHHILHQDFHGPPPKSSHVHREDIKDSDSSQGA